MKWPLTFKVFAEEHKKGFYFICRIWRTKKDMYENLKKDGLEGMSNAQAACVGETHVKKGRTTKNLGRIDFYKSYLCAETISHESTHAAFRWAARKGIVMVDVSDKGPKTEDN